MTKCSNSTIN